MDPIKQLREKMGTAKVPGVGLIDFVSYLDALSIVEEQAARIEELESQKQKLIASLKDSGGSYREMQEAYGVIFAENCEQAARIAELGEQVAILNKENEVAWERVAKLEAEIALCPLCDKPSDKPTGDWSRDDRRKIAMLCE